MTVRWRNDYVAVHVSNRGCFASVYVRVWAKTLLDELNHLCGLLQPGTLVMVYDHGCQLNPEPSFTHTVGERQ